MCQLIFEPSQSVADKPFLKNPYVIGVPLTGDAGFYGRRAVFTFVKDTLNTEQQNVIVLYGQRRVGKTSLLHQLVKQLKGEVLPVYFDLQGRAQDSLGKVLYDLARTIARSLKMSASEQTRFDNAGRFFREEFLPSVYSLLGQRRLLLLFDEFDVLGDELASPEVASETFFPYLQSLIMHERQIVFIFVVGRRIEELATHFQAIFKQAVYRRVGLLQPEDARALVVEPVKEVLAFEKGAVETILNLTAGHPYFTQLICFELFNALKANDQHSVTTADVLKLVSQAIESGHGALTWFWDGLPRAERFIMSAVAHVTDETGLASKEAIRQILEKHRIILTGLELTHAPDRLVEWEMLRREGQDNYRFVVELVRRWIIKMHPLESARRDVDFISQRAVRLYENAREAHTAGDLEYARDEYRRTLAANPNHSGAQLGLAQVLLELEDIEAAIEEFSKAYALDEISGRDGLVQAHLAQGKKLDEANQIDAAIRQYEQALKISPADETIRQRITAIWLGQGHAALAATSLVAATEFYQKALSFDNSETLVNEIKRKFEALAKYATADQDYEKACQVIHQLRKLLPQDKSVLNMEIAIWIKRGDALMKAGKGTEAIQAYQYALELSPGNATLIKKLETVSVEWEKVLETNRLFDQAMMAHQAKDWPTAKTSWLQLLRRDVFTYQGHDIAVLLAETVEATKTPDSPERLSEPELKAQSQPADEPVRQRFQSLLTEAEAGEAPVPPERPKQKAAKKVAPQKQSRVQPYIWVIGGAIIVLIIGGIIFGSNQSSQHATATAEAIVEVTAIAAAQVTNDAATQVMATKTAQAQNLTEYRATMTAINTKYRATMTAINTNPPLANPATINPTVAAIFIARATARAQGIFLFQDDFSSNVNGWEVGEFLDEDGSYIYQFTDGHYRMTLTTKPGTNSKVTGTDVPNYLGRNFLLSVEATVIKTAKSAYILIGFFTSSNASYQVVVSYDGRYAVILLQQSGPPRMIKDLTFSDAIKLEPGVTNSFTILVKDSTFTIYANDRELTAVDATLSQEGIITFGLGLQAADQTTTVDFDNLIIKE